MAKNVLRVRDFHTSWWSTWNRMSERSERVRFLIVRQRVWKSRTKRFPCCNLFILYILRFSHPQKRTTRLYRKYYLVKAARQSYPRWPRKHNSLKPWFVIGRNNFFTCEKLVSPLWLVEVNPKRFFTQQNLMRNAKRGWIKRAFGAGFCVTWCFRDVAIGIFFIGVIFLWCESGIHKDILLKIIIIFIVIIA